MPEQMEPYITSASAPWWPGASAPSQPWFLASACTTEPCARWRRVLAAVWADRSRDQRLVGQPLAGDALDEAGEPLQRVALDVALIQPEAELVNVAVQMLRA